MPIPTEPVGSLPRPAKLQAAFAAYDAGKITHAQLGRRAGCRLPRLDQAHGGDRLADRLRRRAARVELRHLSADRHAGRDRSCAQPRGRRPVLRDLHRRPSSPAAASDRRAVQVQDLCRRLSRQVDQDGDQADEAGGDRTIDAGAPVSARRRGARAIRGSSFWPICATSARRTSASAFRPGRRGSRSTSPRGGSPAATIPAIHGPVATCCPGLHRRSTTACSTGSRPTSARTSASTPAPAATATPLIAPMSTTPSCCPACSR